MNSRVCLAACAVLACAHAAFANDSIGHLSAGGIVLGRSADIEMRSEDLHVSTQEIRVRYRFYNGSDKDITTLEGLGTAEHAHPLQRAFIAEQAMQCGYCVSGVLMSAAALLKQNPNPSEAEVRSALDRNLCRCGAHNRMVRAVLSAASEMAAS